MPGGHYHWPSGNRKLHVALAKDMPHQVLANFDVFARLMNMPKNKVSSGRRAGGGGAGGGGSQPGQGQATRRRWRKTGTLLPASFCVPPVEKQITIIILTTISGICAQVERNKRQNETQLNFRDVPKDPKEPGRALEGHRFEYSATPLDCGGVATEWGGLEMG